MYFCLWDFTICHAGGFCLGWTVGYETHMCFAICDFIIRLSCVVLITHVFLSVRLYFATIRSVFVFSHRL